MLMKTEEVVSVFSCEVDNAPVLLLASFLLVNVKEDLDQTESDTHCEVDNV